MPERSLQAAAVTERPGHRRRQPADAQLHGGAVGNQPGHLAEATWRCASPGRSAGDSSSAASLVPRHHHAAAVQPAAARVAGRFGFTSTTTTRAACTASQT